MAKVKEQAINSFDATTASGLSGKTITSVFAWRHGSVDVVEIVCSGVSYFIKAKLGVFEAGGNNEWDSGSKL